MTQFADAAEDVRDHADPAANQCAHGTVGQRRRRNRIWALHLDGCRGRPDEQTSPTAAEQTSSQILTVQQHRCPLVADLRSRDDGQSASVGGSGIGGRRERWNGGTSASGSSQERGQLIFIGGSGCRSGSGRGGGRSGSRGRPPGGGSGNFERKQQPIDVCRSAGLLRDPGLNLDYLQFLIG